MVRVISFCGIGERFFTVRSRCMDDKGNNPVTDACFFSFTDAREYVTQLRRRWLIDAFRDFVQHKSILYRSSAGDHYRVPSRLNALTRLENAIEIIPTQTTSDICLIIQKSELLLRSILPHTANNSYDAQEAKLGQMLAVCSEELNNRLGIFPFHSKANLTYFT